MLLFWAPDTNVPFGGNKQIYRHIRVLCDHGIDARALHDHVGFRYTWFDNDVPLAYLKRRSRVAQSRVLAKLGKSPPFDLEINRGRRIFLEENDGYREHELDDTDVIVLPEYLGRHLSDTVRDLPLAIFNQNPHGMFRGYGIQGCPDRIVYEQPNLVGVVVVSEHSKRYVSFAFPDIPVHRVINGVDSRVFHPGEPPAEPKLAFMPRKLPDRVEQVINLLHCRGVMRHWKLAPIDDMSEHEVAETLRTSSVFMSTCTHEGFGLPPLEAAVSGCTIVGYTGQAAAEYFDPGYAVAVPQDDVVALAEATADVLRRHEEDPVTMRRRALEFAGQLQDRYSLEAERETATEAWSLLLDRAASLPSTSA